MDEYRALFLDEYALTMAQSFWRHGQNDRVSFEGFVRTLPKNRGYLLLCGLETALDFLTNFRFTEAEATYLRTQEIYDPAFIDFLLTQRFNGDVWAIPEGTVVGPSVPSIRISAPRIIATLIESSLLAILNHQTLIATKSARIVEAAQDRPVWDFSLRRLHGPRAAVGVARAAYIAGCAGTATVQAGLELGVPTTGTMAHSYVQAFGPDGEVEAFCQFLLDYPSRAVLLVDTYDTLQGVRNAIKASRLTSVSLQALRLDSGDLLGLTNETRRILDAEEMPETKILVSNDLDEFKIQALLDAGAPIDSLGVGTMLGTSADAPAIGGVYKLVSQERQGHREDVIKKSASKITDPGKHQVYRFEGKDTIALANETLPGIPLLLPYMEAGKLVRRLPTLAEIRNHARGELKALPTAVRAFENPALMEVKRSPALEALRHRLMGNQGRSL